MPRMGRPYKARSSPRPFSQALLAVGVGEQHLATAGDSFLNVRRGLGEHVGPRHHGHRLTSMGVPSVSTAVVARFQPELPARQAPLRRDEGVDAFLRDRPSRHFGACRRETDCSGQF